MSTLPLASERKKAAREFEKDDIVRVGKSKAEWLQDPHGSAYRRYTIVENLNRRNSYGSWMFLVKDESGEVREQGFGSQIMYMVEEGEQS